MKRLLLVLAAATLALSGCGALTSYAAKVNGTRISENDLDRQLNAIMGNARYLELIDQQFQQNTGERVTGAGGRETFSTRFVALLLEQRIYNELVRQELKRRRIEVTEADLAQAEEQVYETFPERRILEGFPERYVRRLIRNNAEVIALQRTLAPPVADAAIRDHYEANKADFQVNCMRHILIGDPAKGAELKGRITRGEDFAAVARAESLDKDGAEGGTAARGGDLGCVAPGTFEERFGDGFEAGVAALQPGQVSDPIQSQRGFHIVQVTERRTKSLEEATPEIRLLLSDRNAPNVVPLFVAQAARDAKIDVNPRYGKFVREETQLGIRTPNELSTTTTSPIQIPEP